MTGRVVKPTVSGRKGDSGTAYTASRREKSSTGAGYGGSRLLTVFDTTLVMTVFAPCSC